MNDIAARPTYAALAAVPGFRRIAAATLVARTASAMLAVVLVLFTLQRFHPAPLAGLVVFLSIVPGIVVSPLAGTLLDRHRRMILITSDYALAALSLLVITALDSIGRLPAAALLGIVSVGSLTNPLSNSGTRSLFPVLVPRALWERANAVDSGAYVVAAIAGPALAGVLIGVTDVRVALLATAAFYVAGLLSLLSMAEPSLQRTERGSLLGDAVAGLRYVVRSPALRGLALTTAVGNVAYGVISVGMPVLLLTRLDSGPTAVGAMWAVMGLAGLVASVAAGRRDSEHREMWFILTGLAFGSLSLLCLLLAGTVGGGLVLVAAAMALFGIGNGPYDIGLFSLRQRVTAPAWMGRAFAVSMSVNFVGMPIGSAITGPVIDHSLAAAFGLGLAAQLVAAVCAYATLRPRGSAAGRGSGSGGAAPGAGTRPGGRSLPLAAE